MVDRKTFIILVLASLLVLTFGYFLIEEAKDYISEKQQEAFNKGVDAGKLDLTLQIRQQQSVPYLSDKTGNITLEWETIDEVCEK